jgi:hypothetical protein
MLLLYDKEQKPQCNKHPSCIRNLNYTLHRYARYANQAITDVGVTPEFRALRKWKMVTRKQACSASILCPSNHLVTLTKTTEYSTGNWNRKN